MNPDKFAALPPDSVVTHQSSSHSCAYRKHSDGGWEVASLVAPHEPQRREDPQFRVYLGDGSKITLVRWGLTGKISRTELTARLEASRSYVAGLEHERDKLRADNERLRGVLRSAHGTLGAYKL